MTYDRLVAATPGALMHGTVKDFSADTTAGVIRPDDGTGDVPFLASSLEQPTEIHHHQRVEFGLVHGPKGPEAVDIRLCH
jgi:cold shock protein